MPKVFYLPASQIEKLCQEIYFPTQQICFPSPEIQFPRQEICFLEPFVCLPASLIRFLGKVIGRMGAVNARIRLLNSLPRPEIGEKSPFCGKTGKTNRNEHPKWKKEPPFCFFMGLFTILPARKTKEPILVPGKPPAV